jgi:pyridoxamine 5'-phosphate oxidase family protein
MNVFTEAEVAYLQSQPLGRLGTAGPNGQPHVVPVGFRDNPDLETIDTGGLNVVGSKKYRDILRHPRVAFVVDDAASVDPWTVRGLEVRGEAEVLTEGGRAINPRFGEVMCRIRPRRIVSWGLEGDAYTRNARTIE